MSNRNSTSNNLTNNMKIEHFFPERPINRSITNCQQNKYSTGIKSLDDLIGGGFTPGSIIGIGGGPGVGKTTLLLDVSRQIINLYGKYVLYFNVENGLSDELIKSMNITDLIYSPKSNPSGKLLISDESTIQKISEVIKAMLSLLDIGLIIIDTATSVINNKILEYDDLGSSKNTLGQDASMWSKALNALHPLINTSNACMILVHQSREDITTNGTITVPWGGKALRHWASLELWMKQVEYFDSNFGKCSNHSNNNEKLPIGQIINLLIKKNRYGLPHRSVDIPIKFGIGVSKLHLLWNQLESLSFQEKETPKKTKYLTQTGAWFHLKIPELDIDEKRQGKKPIMLILLKEQERLEQYIKKLY